MGDDLAQRGSGAIVASVRGLESDRLVVPQAVAAAQREDAPLLLVHVAEGTPSAEREADAEALVAGAAALARASGARPPVETLALVGDPVALLVTLSTHARRLYVGTAEASAVRPVTAPLHASRISAGAHCPVFLVRGAWTDRTARGARVLAFLARADERDVVAYAEQEARSLGLGLTILHVGSIGDPWPVAADVAVTRVLEPDPDRAHRAIGSPRNELIVISAADLEAVRQAEGVQVVRARYAGTACLVAVVPDGGGPSPGRAGRETKGRRRDDRGVTMPQQRAELEERGQGAVVVGVTGSESDLLTVPVAAAAAAREGCRLLVVHVLGTTHRDATGAVDDALLERLAETGEAVVARAVALARDVAPGLAVDDALLSGDRVAVLGAVTARARRLYVGTSETTAVRPMVPGQVTGGVTAAARCPVLLVRGRREDRGSRVLAYLDTAQERDVVAFAEHEARALGLSLTIVHRSELGDPWPVGEDVAVTVLLVPQQDRARSLLRSARNHLLVFSAGDLRSARAAEGTRTLRSRYSGVACLVAIVPDQTAST